MIEENISSIDVIYNITTRYLIKHRKTTPYNSKANGLTKRANGIVGKSLNKMVSAHKTDWDLKLPSAIHAYNTSKKVTTGRSPYFLVFGQTALHGIEMEIETYRIIVARTGTRNLDLTTRLLAIEDLEETREEALTRTAEVQAKRKEDFDEKLPESHCRSTKTQVNPSSALNRIKYHQSNPSNVLEILDSNLSKRACVFS